MNQFDLLDEDQLANKVIGVALAVHSQLGPGLLENAYKKVLAFKLEKEGFEIEVEKEMPLIMDEIQVSVGYRIDILVQKKLVLELKSVENINDLHMAQTINYLKLGKFKLGLLINFNVKSLRFGIKRVINTK
ncbi:MAG: GxxExxY protein [Algoriphagus sp.]|jgi:GxxExxY protein|tara:strand:+ start:229 stop:624 length:396 start_codon:yes stop_codon:yes gene_type:complete